MGARIAIGIFAASFIGALVAKLLGYENVGYIGAPALVMSGWAALGHLVTLDDDAPGEWSNLEGETSIWRHSVLVLSVKMLVFAFIGVIIYA